MMELAKTSFVVMMDPDIAFLNAKYLDALLELHGRHEADEVLAIGELWDQGQSDISNRSERFRRYVRLHPALMAVNRDLYVADECQLRNAYLTIRAEQGADRLVFGDCTANLLMYAGMMGRSIVDFKVFDRFVSHKGQTSREGNKLQLMWDENFWYR
jgi:hypothetical protein